MSYDETGDNSLLEWSLAPFLSPLPPLVQQECKLRVSHAILEVTEFSKDFKVKWRHSTGRLWKHRGKGRPKSRSARTEGSNSSGFRNYWHGRFCKGPWPPKEKGFISWLLSLFEKPEFPPILVDWMSKGKTEAKRPYFYLQWKRTLVSTSDKNLSHRTSLLSLAGNFLFLPQIYYC